MHPAHLHQIQYTQTSTRRFLILPSSALFAATGINAPNPRTSRSTTHAMQRTLRLADGPDEVHRAAIGKFEIGKYVPKEMLRNGH